MGSGEAEVPNRGPVTGAGPLRSAPLMASGAASRSEDEEPLAGPKRGSAQASGAVPKRRSSSRYGGWGWGCVWGESGARGPSLPSSAQVHQAEEVRR